MSKYPLHVFGGDEQAPNLLFAPGNGFPPPCYSPLLAPLTRDWRVLSLPPRALWPGIGPAPAEPGTWDGLVEDLLAGMAEHDLRDVVAVGHSLGAAVLLQAVLREPQRFRAFALLDPAILTPERLELVRAMRARGELAQLPLAQGALARKHRFSDVQAAFRYWRPKPLFMNMSDESLWACTHSMTRAARHGAGLELSWPRDWEAWYYMSVDTETWSALTRLKGLLPTLLMQGADSDTFPGVSLQRARSLLPADTFVTLPECGHMFPLSHPAESRAALTAWLNGLP